MDVHFPGHAGALTNFLSDILLNVFLAIAVDNLAGADGDDKKNE